MEEKKYGLPRLLAPQLIGEVATIQYIPRIEPYSDTLKTNEMRKVVGRVSSYGLDYEGGGEWLWIHFADTDHEKIMDIDLALWTVEVYPMENSVVNKIMNVSD